MAGSLMMIVSSLILIICAGICKADPTYSVNVIDRPSTTVLSYVDETSSFQQIFNPTFVVATSGTNGKSGILARTQDCDTEPDVCTFCGGSSEKASVLTFAAENEDGTFDFVDQSSVVFGPFDSTDSWGTEDPRMAYDSTEGIYYMFYTAYNGSSIFLSLATSPNPTNGSEWTRYGPVFPNTPGSKSGALLISQNTGIYPNMLFWGDSEIRVAKSNDLTSWPDEGEVVISTRADNFDSQLVEAGPPPLLLSNGDYLFIYNSASLGWPNTEGSAYHVGWVILDGNDPSIIKTRCEEPLLSPMFSFETGQPPYTCNAPNVLFLEAVKPLGNDQFQVFFGGADAVVGTATIAVEIVA